MTDVVELGKARRGSHAERTAAMRRRLIDAAIDTLHDLGYAAATTMAIQNRAGVSRGALVHHFPTKIDLIIATAQAIVADQAIWYDHELRKVTNKRDRFMAISRITWEALKKPSGMALLEIFIATRSDAELARRFPPVAFDIQRSQHQANWRLARAAGIGNREEVRRLTDIGLATMRGLSIQLLYSNDPDAVEDAFNLYIKWKRDWIEDALGKRELAASE
ncbi:TetR/AcrR family transcriptional regulator [Sphingomonas sp. Ag1]|jgi:AcrR family transcriptional regulator|uniref:TetR/AcrR family transcriptional regulator n=1 Tax=Sphingomonas sp. Ag1 TaxID=1642949 RepID=UPI000697E4C7|nr:TetR/AcrR family transcriptional regulator [Sphingomonas sp. Ag1]